MKNCTQVINLTGSTVYIYEFQLANLQLPHTDFSTVEDIKMLMNNMDEIYRTGNSKNFIVFLSIYYTTIFTHTPMLYML